MSDYDPGKLHLKIKLNGVDISNKVPLKPLDERGLPGLGIIQELGEIYDLCTFSIVDGGALSFQAYDELIISDPGETVRYFGGVVTGFDDQEFGIAVDYICTATDFTVLLEKSIVINRWIDELDEDVLADIRTIAEPDLLDFDFSTNVDSLGTVPTLTSSRLSVREVMDEMARRFSAQWYIDYNKNLHWFAVEKMQAPFTLSSSPDHSGSFPYSQLTVNQDALDLINRFTVVGGTEESAVVSDVYPADGLQLEFVVPHFYHSESEVIPIKVFINTGTEPSPTWTLQTLGIKNIDDGGGFDVLYSFTEKFFEFAVAPPLFKSSWQVTARKTIPIRARVRSDSSEQIYGRWFDDRIEDESISSKEEAKQAGRAKLASRSLARVVHTLTVNEPGLRVGMVVRLINSLRSIDGDYLIRRINRSFLGSGYMADSVELGDYLEDYYKLMLDIARAAKGKPPFREDDVLDDILDFSETLTLSEVVAITTSTGPYNWNEFNWGFGKWTGE